MRKIYEYIEDIIVPGLVFIELGSNAGDTAKIINEMILKKTKEYRYVAFEPDGRFWPSMRRLETKYPNLEFFNKAISNVNGKTKLFISSGEGKGPVSSPYQVFDNSSSIKKPMPKIFQCWPGMRFDEEQIVDAIRLDNYRIRPVDFIWCDIQGAEMEFIQGAEQTLKGTRYLFTEYNGEEIYEGCPNLERIMKVLPGWEIVEDYEGDVLLVNKEL